MKKEELSRRDFIKKVMTLSAAAALPSCLIGKNIDDSLNALKAISPNEKINLACCGIGNRGGSIINDLYNTGMVNIVALCDTEIGAAHTLGILNRFPKVPRFQDFRKMFDKMSNQIDAVCIGVPDHTHFPITMLAMSLGKHVYVEKPLARTFIECELMMQAAKKYGVVTQMGNQGHSEANYFQFKAWKEAGIIKDVTAITAHMNSARRWHGWDVNMKDFPRAETVPATLDWDCWQGARPQRSYNHDFINGQWRCWYEYGMGALGDWGAHIIDTAHEFLELGLPYEVNPVKLSGHNSFFFPMSSTICFRFPKRKNMPALDITWYDGIDNQPELPEGYGVSEYNADNPLVGNQKLQASKLNPGKIIYSKEFTFKGGSHGSTLSIIGDKEKNIKYPEVPASPSNHFENFIRACKGEEKTRSPFEVSGPLSQVFCLGVLAQRLNTPLKFDRELKIITNNKLANELLTGEPPRKGWEEFYKL